MMSSNRSEVSTELGLGLVGPERTIVPLTAGLSYSCEDPYAVRMAFEVGTDEPVESAASCDPDVVAMGGGAAGSAILNIAMSSPYGQAQFEVSARAIEEFLQRTYQLVATGQESSYLNFDAELTELLSQA